MFPRSDDRVFLAWTYGKWITVIFLVVAFFPTLAFAARDLESATNTAVNLATTVAKAGCVLGVIAGAALLQVPGAAHHAKQIVIGGVIGIALTFGAPTILGLFRTIFGG